MNGTPIDASNPDNLAVAEEGNYDKAITTIGKDSKDMDIDIEEEHNT